MRGKLKKNLGVGREHAFSEPVLQASAVYHLTGLSKPLMR